MNFRSPEAGALGLAPVSSPRHHRAVERGRFISFEGGEGAGKSTQVGRLAARLRALGLEVATTREPGGSTGADALRALLLTGEADRWSPLAEALLLYAAREDHLRRTIRPSLARGAWVISDRFADSTRAYQGAAGGVSPAFLTALEAEVVGGGWPDLTLILDLPIEQGLARAEARGGAEVRFEGKGHLFHQRLRSGFLALAKREPARCAVIDGSASPEAVEGAVWSEVAARLLTAGAIA